VCIDFSCLHAHTPVLTGLVDAPTTIMTPYSHFNDEDEEDEEHMLKSISYSDFI